jgi:hypothetical protein
MGQARRDGREEVTLDSFKFQALSAAVDVIRASSTAASDLS